MKINLTNIQRFSINDGPGIRTTVFLKGCSIRCPWCSNPENLTPEQQEYIHDGIRGVYGKMMSADELYDEVIKDKTFYQSGSNNQNWNITEAGEVDLLPGGVTFSGGECLLQIQALKPVIEKLHEQEIHTCVETCLFVPEDNLKFALKLIDLFIVDIKILNECNVKAIEKGNLPLYLRNFETLMESGKTVIVRIPVIGGYTDTIENQNAVAKFLSKEIEIGNIIRIEMIKEHNLGIKKYESLHAVYPDITIPNYQGVSDDTMVSYQRRIQLAVKNKIPVDICKV